MGTQPTVFRGAALLVLVAGLGVSGSRRAQAQAEPCATVLELITNDVVGAGVPDDLYLIQVDAQAQDPASTATVRKLTVTYDSLVPGESAAEAEALARAFVGGVLAAPSSVLGGSEIAPAAFNPLAPRAFLVTGEPNPKAAGGGDEATRGHLFELTRTGVLSVTLTHHGPLDLSGDPGTLLPTGMTFGDGGSFQQQFVESAISDTAAAATATATLPVGSFFFTSQPTGTSNLWQLDTFSATTTATTSTLALNLGDGFIPAFENTTTAPADGIEGVVMLSDRFGNASFFTCQPNSPAPAVQVGEVVRTSFGGGTSVGCIDLTSVETVAAYDDLAPGLPAIGVPPQVARAAATNRQQNAGLSDTNAQDAGSGFAAPAGSASATLTALASQLIGVRSPKPGGGAAGANLEGGVYLADQPGVNVSGCTTGTESAIVLGSTLLAAGAAKPEALLHAPPAAPDHIEVTLTPTGEPDTFRVRLEVVDASGEPLTWFSGTQPLDLLVTGLPTTTTSTLTDVGGVPKQVGVSTTTLSLLFSAGVADQLCTDVQLTLTIPGFADGTTGTVTAQNPLTGGSVTGTFTLSLSAEGVLTIHGHGCAVGASDGGDGLPWLLPLALLLAGLGLGRWRRRWGANRVCG